MADDGAGLLDALGIDKAHIVGASMGGMIAQHFAARHADKCLSLTSIFSTTGNPKLPAAKPEAMKALITRPASSDEDALVDHGMMLARTIGSPGYPAAEDHLRERTRASVQRSFYPEGPTRHLSAIVADGDRREMLKQIAVPTLVLHGEDDPLVPCEGGRDTAATIPGARIRTFPDGATTSRSNSSTTSPMRWPPTHVRLRNSASGPELRFGRGGLTPRARFGCRCRAFAGLTRRVRRRRGGAARFQNCASGFE